MLHASTTILHHDHPARFWATGLATVNMGGAAWLGGAAATVGLPFGAAHDPATLQLGASLLGASLLAAAVGAVMTTVALARRPLDDELRAALGCQTIPPLVALAYAALT